MKQIVPGELYAAMAHIDPSKWNSWLDELLWVVLLLSSLTKDLREVCFNNLPLRQSFLHNAQVPYATLQISDRHICSAAKIVGELGLNTTTLLKTDPFYRCLSRIQVSVWSNISRGLTYSPATHVIWCFTGSKIHLYSSLEAVIEGVLQIQETCYKPFNSAVSLFPCLDSFWKYLFGALSLANFCGPTACDFT